MGKIRGTFGGGSKSNMSKTPETDAFIECNIACGPTGWDWRVHSRRLERERDEAREEARIAVGLLSTHPQFAKFHPEEVLEMVKLEAAK